MEPLNAKLASGRSASQPRDPGESMYNLLRELFPLCRSITGAGTLETLERLQTIIPLDIHRIPTGTKVFDWEVPKEWNVRDAWIRNSRGEKIVDFRKSNLHVVSYSIPVHKKVSLAQLSAHLHSLPEYPDWIPYRTSYYHETWGFCLAHNQLRTLKDDIYEVCVEASLEPGHLVYGELVLKGESQDEVLISTHICHPSLCNDNLSGIGVVAFLAKYMMSQRRRYTYRFIFIPGTIGAITWLAINEPGLHTIKHGLVATLLGDRGPFTYKRSRAGNAEIDRAVEYVLRQHGDHSDIREFMPYGYDERQFCSPGFNLPVGCLTRTPYGEFPEYHTSADNLDFVSPPALAESLEIYRRVVRVLEVNQRYLNLKPKCEPQLGRYGLYDSNGGNNNGKRFQMALLWVLNLSDGQNSLLDIAKRSALPLELLADAAARLQKAGLLRGMSETQVSIKEDQ